MAIGTRYAVQSGWIRRCLDHGLHPDIDNAALERLYQVVQVIDFPFREDDEHLLSPFHHLDGGAFCLVVPASALHRKSAEALEPPAGDTAAFVERLTVHHVEEPAVAAAGEFQAGLEVRLIGVVGGEDDARPAREIPQHLEVAPFQTQTVPPGQVDSEVSLNGPDHPSLRSGRSKTRVFRHGVLLLDCQFSPALTECWSRSVLCSRSRERYFDHRSYREV